MKKKLMAMTLSICMATGALTGCGNTSSQPTTGDTQLNTETTEQQIPERDFTFGFSYMSYSEKNSKGDAGNL